MTYGLGSARAHRTLAIRRARRELPLSCADRELGGVSPPPMATSVRPYSALQRRRSQRPTDQGSGRSHRRARATEGVSSVLKPSCGLEPQTPSLPWRFRGGTGGHDRTSAITFFLQMGPPTCVADARACPHVHTLMYPSRTRGALTVTKTDNTG